MKAFYVQILWEDRWGGLPYSMIMHLILVFPIKELAV